MRKELLLMAVVLFCAVGVAVAAEAQAPGELHGNVGITYNTLYVWRGYTVYGADSAIHPFIDLDLFGSGFHLETVGHIANGGGNVDGERWDYSLYYAGACEIDQPWETRYMVGYRYFNYPKITSHESFKNGNDIGSIDLQEAYAGVAFPRVLGIPGLVPGYAIVKGWPSNSDTIVGDANPNGTYSGWAHIFMLDYALPVPGLTAETPEQILNFHAETVYNSAVDPRPLGGYTSRDWTHLLLGVTTDFDLGNNLIVTPGLWHQITFEDNGTERIPGVPTSTKGVGSDHDITWASLTVKYKF